MTSNKLSLPHDRKIKNLWEIKLKEKSVSKRSKQKSQRISQLLGILAYYGGKKLWVYGLKWKSEGTMDDDWESGDDVDVVMM